MLLSLICINKFSYRVLEKKKKRIGGSAKYNQNILKIFNYHLTLFENYITSRTI